MMIATLKSRDGKKQGLLIGLSFANLRQFLDAPRKTFTRLKGESIGLPMDLLVFSGETDESLAEMMEELTTNPKMSVSERLKN